MQERLAVEAARLPAAAEPPVILSPLSSTSRLLKIGVSSKTLSQMDLTMLAKWTIRPRLMAIPAWRTSRSGASATGSTRSWSTPSGSGQRRHAGRGRQGGDRYRGGRRRRVHRHAQPADRRPPPLGRSRRPRTWPRSTVAFRNGAPLRLGDVADVKIGFPPPIGDAVINDGQGLLLIVEKQPTGNTLEVTRKVEKALEALRAGLKGVDIDPTIFRPATFIERSLDNLAEAMIIGCGW